MKRGCKIGTWPMGKVTDATCREFWSMEDSRDWELLPFGVFTSSELV